MAVSESSDSANPNRVSDPSIDLMTHHDGKVTFPSPRGPNSVGCVDVMTPGRPRNSVYGRIFYPTDMDGGQHSDKWVPYLSDSTYLNGLCNFINCMASKWPSWAPKRDMSHFEVTRFMAPFCPEMAFRIGFKSLVGSNFYLPLVRHAPLKKDEAGQRGHRYPVIVFSHGIGCSREMYSQFCADWASFGFVVAAIEHRDGSACVSRSHDPMAREGSSNRNLRINHRFVSSQEDEYEIRNEQVHFRSNEVSRMMDLMVRIDEGKLVKNVALDNQSDSSQVEEAKECLKSFSGRLDFKASVLIGHSFGGATTLLNLSRDHRFSLGVLMDPWMFPIRDEVLAPQVKQPMLFINTETFRLKENLRPQEEFKTQPMPSTMRKSCYIRGSVHQNQFDMPVLVRQPFLRRALGMESAIDPLEFMAVNNNLILNFVWTAVHGFSHPKIDEELEAAERQIVWGFDYGDALSLADDELITTSPDVRKLHEEMVRQQDAEREKRLFGRR